MQQMLARFVNTIDATHARVSKYFSDLDILRLPPPRGEMAAMHFEQAIDELLENMSIGDLFDAEDYQEIF